MSNVRNVQRTSALLCSYEFENLSDTNRESASRKVTRSQVPGPQGPHRIADLVADGKNTYLSIFYPTDEKIFSVAHSMSELHA
eukprot:1300092-Pyramimonas_sp.AAC.1